MLLWQRYEEAVCKTCPNNYFRKRPSDTALLGLPQGAASRSGASVRPRRRDLEPMLEGLQFAAGCISLLVGATLVYDAVRNPGLNQTPALLGGAVLVSLGFICMWLVVRSWMEFRRYLKDHHQRAQR
jgi:hypothetical protein